MIPWLFIFHALLEENYILCECVYNSDQTGLYYQKLPNTLHFYMEHKKSIRGCKQIKDKTHITVMLFTS